MTRQTKPKRDYPLGAEAYSIDEFCETHGIGRSKYFELRKKGMGPKEIRLGGRVVVISRESAAAWRAARDAEEPTTT